MIHLKILLPFRKFSSFHFLSSIDLELTMKPALDLVLKLISQISFTAIKSVSKSKTICHVITKFISLNISRY